MPSLAHPGVASIELLLATDQGPLCENTLYMHQDNDTEFTSGQILAMMAAVTANWAAGPGAVTTNHVSLTGVRGQSLHSLPYGPVLEDLYSTPIAGGVSGDAAPFSVCAVIQFLGAPGGRPRRSYIRHAGVPESAANGNILNSSYIGNAAGEWESFCEAVRDAGPINTHHSILSEQLNGAASASENDVDTYACRATLGRAASRSGTRA